MWIELPNTYRNRSRKSTGWMVAKASTWGLRVIPMMLRLATARASAAAHASFDRRAGERGTSAGAVTVVMRQALRWGRPRRPALERAHLGVCRPGGPSAGGTRRRGAVPGWLAIPGRWRRHPADG